MMHISVLFDVKITNVNVYGGNRQNISDRSCKLMRTLGLVVVVLVVVVVVVVVERTD